MFGYDGGAGENAASEILHAARELARVHLSEASASAQEKREVTRLRIRSCLSNRQSIEDCQMRPR